MRKKIREEIQDILEREPNKELAAFMVCQLVDEELVLLGIRDTGWFDDDTRFFDWVCASKGIK
jgi:hypothetical protein